MGVPIPFLTAARAEFVPPEGTLHVYLTVKEVPAYTRINREHLFDASGKPKLLWLTPEDIEKSGGLLTQRDDILGRVVSHDIRAGYGFTDKDFLPKGTRAGVEGGIPPGKRALVIDASKVHGIHALKLGDHFDLLASVMVEPAKGSGPMAPPAEKKQAVVKALVQNGVVVKPVANRPPAQGSPKKNNDKPVEEIVIAVEPEEIASLTAALAVGSDIMAAYRSGHPDDAKLGKDVTPGTPPPVRPTTIEVIQGTHREFVSFYPPSKTSPSPASPSKSAADQP
jgi:Flp pilus assembly protein CpaB